MLDRYFIIKFAFTFFEVFPLSLTDWAFFVVILIKLKCTLTWLLNGVWALMLQATRGIFEEWHNGPASINWVINQEKTSYHKLQWWTHNILFDFCRKPDLIFFHSATLIKEGRFEDIYIKYRGWLLYLLSQRSYNCSLTIHSGSNHEPNHELNHEP